MSEAREILARLVALKDGPRDEHYRAAKKEAWADARALLDLDVCGNCGCAKRPGMRHSAMSFGMCQLVAYGEVRPSPEQRTPRRSGAPSGPVDLSSGDAANLTSDAARDGRPNERTQPEPRVSMALRLPVALHERLKAEASGRDVSVNWLITHAVDRYLASLSEDGAR